MKRIFLLLLLEIMVLSLNGQHLPAKYQDLMRRVSEINSDSSSSKVTLSNEGFMARSTDGGGELTGYFKLDQVQKITRQIWLSHGIEEYGYFFTNGKLIYVYETFRTFPYNIEQNTVDYSTTELSFIGRYYFNDNKLIDSETIGRKRFEHVSKDIQEVLRSESNDSLMKLQQKRKNSQ